MSVTRLQGCQVTDTGGMPMDWSALPLGAIASARKDRGVAKQGVPCVELEHIEPATGRLLGWDSRGAQASIKTAFQRGDVLFGKLRPYLRKYAVAPFDGICTTEVLAIYPRDGLSDRRFLFHLMQGDGVFATVTALSYGTKMPRVSWTDLSDIVLCVPPLPEQRKIAAILTVVDDKLDVIARQIEAAQTLKQGLMQTLFNRGVGIQDAVGRWVPHTEFKKISSLGIPAMWNVRRLGDIAPLVRRSVEINLDATYPELGLRSYGKGTFHKPALLGSDVGNKRLFQIKAGDLLFSNVFAWEGAVAVARPNDDGRYGSHRYMTCVVDEALADTSYVFRYLTTPAGIASLTLASPGGAGRNKTLGLGALADITMPLPPLDEQRKISQILDGVDAKLRVLESKQVACSAMKRGLMQKLLTGEWRVTVDFETVPACDA